MGMNVLVGDFGGVVMGEIPLHVSQVSWRLNEVGQVVGDLPLTDVARHERLLRFGNTLLLQFDNGLPDWGGVLDTPRAWQHGQVRVHAYSGEYLLRLRLSGKNEVFRQHSVGEIFRSVLVGANGREALGMQIATPWYGGATHNLDYHYKPLFDIARELTQDLSKAEFQVSAAEVGGQIVFTARFDRRRGRDHDGISLMDGRNITEATLDEQGPIINHWYVVGSGTSWYGGRYVAEERDGISVNRYRLREASEIQSQIGNPSMLHAIAEQRSAANSTPTTSVPLTAVDLPPARFSDYDVGDSLPVDIPRYGFNGFTGRVRILGREYVPDRGVCNLLVTEYSP